jgi:hypothetical protein
MTAIRKTASATASARRSAVRAPRKTAVRKTVVRKTVVRKAVVKIPKTPARTKATTADAPTPPRSAAVAARLATIARTRKPIDAAVVFDSSDEDGKRRAAQALARAAAAATKAATATTPAKKTPVKKAPAKKAPVKKTATKKTATKKTVAKKAPANRPTAKATTADAPTPRTRGPSGVKRTAVDCANDPPPETGVALIDRVRRSIEREITRIEVIVGGHHVDPEQRTEAERRARTLASLTKTLAELRRLRADDELQRPLDDDAIPRDLDEFRRALSRRLEQLVADAAQPAAAGHD